MKKHSSIMFDEIPTEDSENAISSGGVFKAIQGAGGGVSDYESLSNKPKINNIELAGNKSLSLLGIASNDELTSVSDRLTQAESDIGNLGNLSTTVKTDLVSALNEVANSSGGSSGTVIDKYVIPVASREVRSGRIQIDVERSALVGKTIVAVNINGVSQGMYKIIGACMNSDFFDVHILYEQASDVNGMIRLGANLKIGFDVYYMR